jgi:hypothetical protein
MPDWIIPTGLFVFIVVFLVFAGWFCAGHTGDDDE